MNRLLLATTAVATLMATAVIAQDASSSMMSSSEMPSESSMMSSSSMPMDSSMMSSEMPMDSSMMSSEMPMDSSMMSSEPMAPFDITTGYTQVDTDRLATRIIGQPVYDGTAADSNNVGNINDLVIDESGAVQAVVIGVGGFLGIGEKQVAVAYSSLQWVVAADNTERFVIDATADQLTAAPDFVTVEDDPADNTSDVLDSTMSSSAAQ